VILLDLNEIPKLHIFAMDDDIDDGTTEVNRYNC